MAGFQEKLKFYNEFSKENRKELDSILFVDMINGFLDRMIEIGFINEYIEYDREINGKIIHQKAKSNSVRIMRKTVANNYTEKQRFDGEIVRYALKMKDVTMKEINKVFGNRLELKNKFLDEIYFPYYVH